MLSSIVRFGDDAAALEKSLRFLQYACQAAIGLVASSATSKSLVQAQSQLALGRRYFRLLKWHPSWSIAYHAFNREQAALGKLIEVTKWFFLGLYFFIEMFTITNAMRVTNYQWGPMLQEEANKCWLYSIAASIILSLYQLLGLRSTTPTEKQVKEKPPQPGENEEPSNTAAAKSSSSGAYSKIYTQLVIDCCDVLIPIAALNWATIDPVVVGTAGSISTLLAGRKIWFRVQGR